MACFCCGGTADVALPKDEGDRLNHYGLVRCPPPKLRRKEIAVPVKLNVYSLTDTNKKLTKVGMGVFHTGVVVYGVEWGYGESVGNPNASGLFYTSPGMAAGALHRTITVGHTTKSPSQVDTILHRLENEWKSADYHILSNNCNHFAQELLNLLSTREKLRVPSWCNRAARFTNVVIPRKMATMVQRKLGGTPAATTDTSGKHGSTSMPKSIIPAYWYRHPDVYQPPRYTATDAPQVVHLQNIHVQQPSVPSRRLRQKTASQMNEMNGEDGLEPYRTDQGSASREMDATAPPRHPPAAPASRRKYLSDTPLDHEMAESMELFSSRECEDAERMEADDDASMRPHAAMSHGPAMTIYLSTQGSAYSPLAGDSDAPDMMMGRHRSTAAAAMDGDGVVFDEADFLFGLQQPPFVEMEDEMPLVASQTPVVVGPSADPTSQQHAAGAPLSPPTPAEEVPELPSSSTNTATDTEHSKHRRVRRRKHVLPDAAPDTAHSRRSATSTEEVPPPAELVEEAKPAAPPPKMLKKVHAAPPPASARSAVAAKKAKTHHRASPDQQAFSDPMASAVDAPRSTASPPTSAQDCGSSDSPHLNHTAPATTPEKKKVLRKKEKAKVGVPAKTSSRQAATTPPQQETQHQHTQPSVDGVRPAALQLPLPTSVESGAALELCFSGSIATPVEAAGLPIDANNAQRCIPLPPIPDAHHHASPMTSSPTSVRSPRHASSLSADAISAAANSLADDVPSPHPRHHQPVCGEAGRRGGASRSTRRNSTGSCTNSQRSSSAPPRSMSVQTLTHRSPSRPPSVPRGKMEVNVAHRGPQTARARINTTSSTRGARSASASARTLAKRPATSLAATAERRGRKTPMSVRPSSATSTH